MAMSFIVRGLGNEDKALLSHLLSRTHPWGSTLDFINSKKNEPYESRLNLNEEFSALKYGIDVALCDSSDSKNVC